MIPANTTDCTDQAPPGWDFTPTLHTIPGQNRYTRGGALSPVPEFPAQKTDSNNADMRW